MVWVVLLFTSIKFLSVGFNVPSPSPSHIKGSSPSQTNKAWSTSLHS